jgi:hypothetical protein
MSRAAAPILRVLATLAILSLAAAPAAAQRTPAAERALAIRVPGGAFIPTGDQGRALKGAQVTAVQMAWTVRPALAVTGTFAWTNSRSLLTAGTPRLDLFTADLGLERRLITRCAECHVAYTGFAGVGAGARRYDQRGAGVDAATAFSAYLGAGGEILIDRVGVRLEARDYMGSMRVLTGASDGLRNDVVLMLGLRLSPRR